LVVALLLAASSVVPGVAAAAPRVAGTSSLPSLPAGERPGPDILYAQPPVAPQLQNVAPWSAAPIMVSGAEAYRQGEFLYQDYLFDDHGAAKTADPNDPIDPASNLFSPTHGTVTYPTDSVYGNNTADLVELRVRPLAGATAFRVTLNALNDASKVGFTVALGTSSAARAWPFGAGVSSPAQLFLTVHGTTAVLTDAATGNPVTPAPTATVSVTRRQFDVRIPHAAWNPGTGTVRMGAGVGLWDVAGNKYLLPGAIASATQPGGCATACPAFFNMAFRLTEPLPKIYSPGDANTIAEGGAGVKLDGTWWREKQQGDALAAADVSAFSASVSFSKLAAAVDDESRVPQTGHFDRIFASHFSYGKTIDYSVKCFPSNPVDCPGRFRGQLQPYGVYVPSKPVPAAGYGLVLAMHGLSANYNEFLGSHNASQFGDRGAGSIVASPEARGADGFYHGYAESDVFEMWADVARNYKLNPDMADVSGYSMGGEGTYLLSTRWPDLFARAFPIVGPPTSAASYRSLRNLPVMAWYSAPDELVGPELSEQSFLNALNAGIRYDHWVMNASPPFPTVGHITIGNNDEFAPAAVFLGDHTVDRNPPHVTYTRDPSLDFSTVGLANHAYWLSGIGTRGTGTGTVDVTSQGFGVGDAPVLSPAISAGLLSGGSHPLPLVYQERNLQWGPTPAAPVADQLDITVSNVSAATIDVARAHVDCKATLKITTDGPFTAHLTGCTRTVSASAGTTVDTVAGAGGGMPLTGASPGLLHGTRAPWLPAGGLATLGCLIAIVGFRSERRLPRRI
jgi:hypothetical protein